MVKIASNQEAAQVAVSGIKKITISDGQKCRLGKSNLTCMKKGVPVSNQLLKDITKLVSCVSTQANKFPKLAAVIASRDSQTKF